MGKPAGTGVPADHYCLFVVNAVDANTSHLLVAALCSFLVVVVLLPCLLFLIYKRVHRATSVKSSLTSVVTQHMPPSPNCDFTSKLPDVSSGYSGSGSGVLSFVFDLTLEKVS